ncbi:peptidyl-tRNA hydrolase [Neosynchiropus ocellatus]
MTANVLCNFYGHLWAFIKRLWSVLNMSSLVTRFLHRVWLSEAFPRAMTSDAQPRGRMVVGLGNPGMQGTRHNVGMAVVGALASRLGVGDRWRGDQQVSGDVVVSQVEQTQVVLLRPRLLMNISGASVARAASKFGVRPEDVLLIHDDLDKPLGKVLFKHGGSARGHNGVRSCIDCLQTDVMLRLRVGIGRPKEKTLVDRYVLGRFSSEEKKLLDSVLDRSVDLVLSQLSGMDTTQCSASPTEGGSATLRRPQRRAEET